MKLAVPRYYKNFHCIGGACHDNCCRGAWLVNVDEDTVKKYEQMPGDLGETLRKVMFKEGGETFLKRADEACPLLNADGLCKVVKLAGEQALGTVCHQFPRFSEYFGTCKETGIGLACEEAARIVFDAPPEYADLIEEDLTEEFYDDPEYDSAWDMRVVSVRDSLDQLLKEADKRSEFDFLLAVLQFALVKSASLQQCANKEDWDAFDRQETELKKGTQIAQGITESILRFENSLRPMKTNAAASRNLALLGLLDGLESIGQAWDEELEKLKRFFGTEPRVSGFAGAAADFEAQNQCLASLLARYARYLLFRYFRGAAYDHDLLGKTKLIALFVLLLEMMLMEGMPLPQAVHLFSRQVEYDEDNMEQIAEDLTFERCARTDELVCALSHFTKQI